MAAEEKAGLGAGVIFLIFMGCVVGGVFAIPEYANRKARPHWSKATESFFRDIGACRKAVYGIAVAPFSLDVHCFAPLTVDEKRLRPCMEERGWEWIGD